MTAVALSSACDNVVFPPPSACESFLNDDLIALMRARLCSPQWSGVVRALGEELATELSDDELRRLMHRVGVRFASAHPLADARTLTAMAAAANALWAQMEWGRCMIDEQPDGIAIRHCLAPTALVFPDAAWPDGFLEGVYARWFVDAGMPAELAVSALPAESIDVRRFRVARAQPGSP
ncbi:hypothetical protein LDO31_10020 [Luteimonas sp. XNQY3]|nr:hypothetical protein [Luteimonas sp. XNQY3]MCD9006565.1 hypothetical protein [Luteimonas sp. XNQY3]